jgi:hypothetical protein
MNGLIKMAETCFICFNASASATAAPLGRGQPRRAAPHGGRYAKVVVHDRVAGAWTTYAGTVHASLSATATASTAWSRAANAALDLGAERRYATALASFAGRPEQTMRGRQRPNPAAPLQLATEASCAWAAAVANPLDSWPEQRHTAVMRKWVYIAVAILVAAMLAVMGWQVLRPQKPVYQGKPVSVSP